MNLEQELLKLIQERGFSIEQLAKKLSTNKKIISAKNLSKKLSNKKIHFKDVQKILDILGYEIKIIKDN